MTIEPGVEVDIREPDLPGTGTLTVSYRENDHSYPVDIRATGEIRNSALGRVYRDRSTDAFIGNYVFEPDSIPLLDEPNGDVIATLVQTTVEPIRPGAPTGPYVEVRASSSVFRARGYVRRSHIYEPEPSDIDLPDCNRFAQSRKHPPDEDDFPYVPGDTWLHLRPDGPVFGYAEAYDRVVCDRAEGGWRLVWVPSEWGPVRAWVRPDVDPNCGAQERPTTEALDRWRRAIRKNVRERSGD